MRSVPVVVDAPDFDGGSGFVRPLVRLSVTKSVRQLAGVFPVALAPPGQAFQPYDAIH